MTLVKSKNFSNVLAMKHDCVVNTQTPSDDSESVAHHTSERAHTQTEAAREKESKSCGRKETNDNRAHIHI